MMVHIYATLSFPVWNAQDEKKLKSRHTYFFVEKYSVAEYQMILENQDHLISNRQSE